MASVTFTAIAGGDGSTVTDDASDTTGLDNGGHRTRLVPMFAQAVAVAATAVAASTTAQGAASQAAGFVSTSTTSNSVATGAKTFTIEAAKQFTAGVSVTVINTGTPANFLFGTVTSYNSTTGALVLDITVIGGSGTFTAWTISLSGARGATGATGMPVAATAAELRGQTDNTKYITSLTFASAAAIVSSSVTGTVTLDFATGFNFVLTLTGNLTLNVPTNMADGQSGVIYFIQDATGSRTLTLHASIKKPGGVAPTLSTAASTIDRLGYFVRGTTLELTLLEKAFA